MVSKGRVIIFFFFVSIKKIMRVIFLTHCWLEDKIRV